MSSSSADVEKVQQYKVTEEAVSLKRLKRFEDFEPPSNEPARATDDLPWPIGGPDNQTEVDNEAENSPYLMVRAAVPAKDDPDMPANTVRMWVIGLLFTCIGSSFNTVLSLRTPTVALTPTVVQFFAFYVGNFWHKVMPSRVFTTFGRKWSLNPGPFNYKEHTCISIMATVGFGNDYVGSFLVSQQVFYKQTFGLLFQLLLSWTVQMLGLSLAGIARRFLVYPASALWPSVLAQSTLIHTLHKGVEPPSYGRWKGITRYKFFIVVMVACLFWHFFPLFIFPALSAPVFLTWIWPNNVLVNQLFGASQGLGILPLTFDWSTVSGYQGSPLVVPWYAAANILVGVFVIFVLGSLGLNFGNVWYGDYLPISESSTYDNTQMPFNATSLLTPDFQLDPVKYQNYSPLFLPTTFALAYGVSFAAIAATLPYIYLHHGANIRRQLFRKEGEDIHMKLMRKYPETPDWWYAVLYVVMFSMTLAVALAWPTHLAWWAVMLTIVIAIFYVIPIGIIASMTNVYIGLNVITEFIIGYLQPGKPVAMMLFKTYGYITMSQALTFTGDMKLAHYMKVPQRQVFWVQLVATFVGSTVDVFVLRMALQKIPNICTKLAPMHFSCSQSKVFYNASIIWGLLGPARIFSIGKLYSGLLLFFPIGFICPILVWLYLRKYPDSWVRFVNVPVIFTGSGSIPPATVLNYATWGIVGWVFNYLIKKNHSRWWTKYNYILSVGMDLGLAIVTIFLGLVFSIGNIKMPEWWGVTVGTDTLDYTGGAIRKIVADGEHFGPPLGSWS
ncbi:OPT oligopeptide transporter protein-domain-containing protein [Protomyces lactucae-debilis]|uniref:OPT oligopeptide transporter protein-domain-containing protein n=1 Tax=Protomyces lactucae-debilis TaxID=2754530 RepID=A0A1Y2EZK0_PROLT|nr:OPT oligopeptide transporter protein-domain-containing protein [Protomyces lactucae-debilis]ORY77000.1 OPT oligopeptide transporter protein-domain-containing protein [Protomyces lactucae-debilis]